MKKQLKGCSCFSVSAILISALIFVFGVVEIVFVSFHELQKTEETSGPWPFNQRSGYMIFVVTLSFLLPPLPLIITAVATRQRLFILWACFFLVGAFTSLLVFGAVTIRTSQKDLSEELFGVMKSSRTNSKLANWISLLQYEYKCCGVTGYSDWSLFDDRPNSSDFPLLRRESVPYTCCRREEVNIKPGCGNGVLQMDGDSRKKIIYTRPCGPIASKVFQGKLLQLGLEMLIAAFASVICAIFLYCGATEIFCFGSNTRNVDSNGDNSANVESTKSGGSDLSCQLDRFIDENENNVRSSDKPDGKSEGLPNKIRIKSSKELMRRQIQNARASRASREGNARMRQASPGDNRSMNSGSSKSRSRSRRSIDDSSGGLKGQKFQVKAVVKGRNVFKDQVERKKLDSRSKAYSRQGHTYHVRSAAVKDVNANPTRNNMVETLFKGIDMNSSVLSTTPNSNTQFNFPYNMNKNGSRSSTIIGKGTPSVITMMKDPTLQGIKSTLPPFTHFASLPMFQIVKLHSGESAPVYSHFSPHFVHKTLPYPSSTLQSRQAYIAVPSPSFFKPQPTPPSDDVPPTDTKNLETEVQAAAVAAAASATAASSSVQAPDNKASVQELPQLPIIQCEETMTIGQPEDNPAPQTVEIQLEIEAETSSSTEDLATSTGRSLTIGGGHLATIVEESESLKSSPENGSSPEMSEKGSEFTEVGGEWEQSSLAQTPLTSSFNQLEISTSK